MNKSFSTLFIFVFASGAFALEQPLPPKIEAVPAPEIEASQPKGKVNGSLTGAAPTDLGLIKTEKKYVDKSCKLVKGKMKCPPKFKRRKTIK